MNDAQERIEALLDVLKSPNSKVNSYLRDKLYRKGYLMKSMVDRSYSITDYGEEFLKDLEKAMTIVEFRDSELTNVSDKVSETNGEHSDFEVS